MLCMPKGQELVNFEQADSSDRTVLGLDLHAKLFAKKPTFGGAGMKSYGNLVPCADHILRSIDWIRPGHTVTLQA